jgi:hypothetical protein
VGLINAYVPAFFDKYLKQQDAHLLDGAATTSPEVELRTLAK